MFRDYLYYVHQRGNRPMFSFKNIGEQNMFISILNLSLMQVHKYFLIVRLYGINIDYFHLDHSNMFRTMYNSVFCFDFNLIYCLDL